jgi:hypothetical protein
VFLHIADFPSLRITNTAYNPAKNCAVQIAIDNLNRFFRVSKDDVQVSLVTLSRFAAGL